MRNRLFQAVLPMLGIASLFAAGVCAVRADDYPVRSIRLIVPFAPGGVTDTSARAVADRLGARLGQQVVVENRPGANGNIGSEQVARATPDGYTLLLGFDGTLVINPHVYPQVPFDPLRDFSPITKLGDATLVLITATSVPARNFRELVALSKAKPGTLSYGTSGTGSTPHVAGERLKQQSGLDMVHVPYKGGGQAIGDLAGGQLPLVFTAIATAQPFIRTGRANAIAVAGAARSPALPEVPTFIESGVSGFEPSSWVALLAPPRTPRAIVDRLQRETALVLAEPEVRARYATLGIDPVGNTPEQFAEQMRADLARWGVVVKQAGIRLEN
jgi:tripartite-type tricarboxylate transporter receptor subunit TctC